MRTRRGACYYHPSCGKPPVKRSRILDENCHAYARSPESPFWDLPDDLILSILTRVSSTASRPSDLISVRLVCHKFDCLASHPLVLLNANRNTLMVKACRWSNGAFRHLKLCADVGNAEACYTLGMIQFYCLQNREEGFVLLSRAAESAHASALHSLAVIHFNGTRGTRKQKNLKAGVFMCARAAALGHIAALRELGHCLQDGYGINKNVLEGRRLLLEANAREAAAAIVAYNRDLHGLTPHLAARNIAIGCYHHDFLYKSSTATLNDAQRATHAIQSVYRLIQSKGCPLLSDFGCDVPPVKLHSSHQFMVDWHKMHPAAGGLRLCSNENCGRMELRLHEFRRCSACGNANYCSRACQALDWKLRHRFSCAIGAGANRQNRMIDHNRDHGAGNDNNDRREGSRGGGTVG